MAGDGALHFAGEGAGVGGIIEADVVDGEALCAQFACEVPHGGEDQRQLLLVMGDVACFLRHLHHQHGVAGLVIAQG